MEKILVSQPHRTKRRQRSLTNFCLQFSNDLLTEFCRKTHFHGLCHIDGIFNAKKEKQNMSRLLHQINLFIWICVVCLAAGFAFYLNALVLDRHARSPTITVIETSNYGLSNFAFPGVAICNTNSVWKPNMENVTKKLLSQNVSQIEADDFLGNLSALIELKAVDESLLYIFDLLEKNLNYTADSLMKELAQPCSRMLYYCQWLTRAIDCNEIFRMAKTELGYCCVFNYKADRQNPDLGTSVEDLKQMQTPEIRFAGAGEDVGLRAFVRSDRDEYVSGIKYYGGFEILIFDSYDYPQQSFIAASCPLNTEIAIGVKPVLNDIDSDVLSLPELLRGCRFHKENQNFIMSEQYSYKTCMVECRVRAILRQCDCLPFFFPHLDYRGNGSQYRICNYRDLNCLEMNKHEYYSLPLDRQFYSIFDESLEGLSCNCTESCHFNFYNTETFQMTFMDKPELATRKKEIRNIPTNSDISMIKVYYKQLSCMKYSRQIFITWDNLISSIGGIYALCIGGSVISILQVGYYMTIKAVEIGLSIRRQMQEKHIKMWIEFYKSDYRKPSSINIFDTNGTRYEK